MHVFVSYARDDDASPPSSSAEPLPGFVSTFYGYLEYQLKQLSPRPTLWRDTRNIEDTDQFRKILKEEVSRSDYFIPILSTNWLTRDWCQRELEWFHQHWAHEGIDGVRRRVLLVNKTEVERSKRPELLQGQGGHKFFTIDENAHQGARERPYFAAGKIRDDRFVQEIIKLASKLHRLALAEEPVPDAEPERKSPPRQRQPEKLRSIFVAQPADDMRDGYARVLNELRNRGYGAVPERDIPNDDTAVAFIDAALAGAELSIHLLGEKRGYAPPEEDPIVKLQLTRAAARAQRLGSGQTDSGLFRRIVWAPKFLPDVDVAAPAGARARDPLTVLGKFGGQIDSDKVESDTLSRFVEFLLQYLADTEPRRAQLELPIEPGRQVYLEHDQNDTDYVIALAEALQNRSLVPVLPVLEGPRNLRNAYNLKKLRACDAVALFWGTCAEVTVMSSATRILQSWRRLGRTDRYSSALLAGPPGNEFKHKRVKIKPAEVDVVLDLTDRAKPTPEDFDPWLGPRPMAAGSTKSGTP